MTKRVATIWREQYVYAVERGEAPCSSDEGMAMNGGTVYAFTLWGARRRARRWTRSLHHPRYVEMWP